MQAIKRGEHGVYMHTLHSTTTCFYISTDLHPNLNCL